MSISKLDYLIQSSIPKVYDDSMSFYELLAAVMAKLNEVIDDTNEFVDDMNGYVVAQLLKWKDDGTLDGIINHNIFDTLNTQFAQIHYNVLFPPNNLAAAIGDGNTDDTAAIQAIIDYVVSLGGGTLFFPKGNYKITSALTWKCENITIEGGEGSKITPYNCDGLVFGDTTGTVRYNYTRIKGLYIDLSYAAYNNGIVINNSDEFHLEDLVIYRGQTAIKSNYGYNGTLMECVCVSQTVAAIDMDCTDKLTIIRGQFGNGEKGIIIRGGKTINIIGASIERNNNLAIEIMGSMTRGGEYPEGVNILGNYLERNAQLSGEGFIKIGTYDANLGIYADNIIIQGNYFNWDINNPRNPSVPILYFDKCSAVTITNNRYGNTSNYAGNSDNAYINTIVSLNDACTYGREMIISKKAQFFLPFRISVTTDTTGFGSYTYDTTPFLLSELFVTGNINANMGTSSTKYYEVSYAADQTNFTVKVHGAPASSTVTFEGLIMGTQKV